MSTPKIAAIVSAVICLLPPLSAKPDPADRELAAPAFPASFKDRSSDEGTLPTEFGDATYQDMIARNGGVTLVLRRFCVPLPIWAQKTPKQMLDDARQNILRGAASIRLVSEKDFVVDGFPGRSFVFSEAGGAQVFRMDYFLLKPDLFIYSCFGSASDLEQPEILAFFASIRTIEKEQASKGSQASQPTPTAVTPPAGSIAKPRSP